MHPETGASLVRLSNSQMPFVAGRKVGCLLARGNLSEGIGRALADVPCGEIRRALGCRSTPGRATTNATLARHARQLNVCCFLAKFGLSEASGDLSEAMEKLGGRPRVGQIQISFGC